MKLLIILSTVVVFYISIGRSFLICHSFKRNNIQSSYKYISNLASRKILKYNRHFMSDVVDDIGDSADDDIFDQLDDFTDDEDDFEDDEIDKMDDFSDESSKKVSWLERRKQEKSSEASVNRGPTWEERFEDDPLQADSPTYDWEPEKDYLTKMYIAISDVTELNKRSEAWIHHMQWVRRIALNPEKNIVPLYSYTRLSTDCMYPEGQIIAVRANSTEVFLNHLSNEPLSINGGCSSWKLYEMELYEHDNTTWYITDPLIFIGANNDKITKPTFKKLLDAISRSEVYQSSYHPGIRVCQYARLLSVDKAEDREVGIAVVLNSKSVKAASRYISDDPIIKEKFIKTSILSPINIQDIDGLHQMMARSFAEKAHLDLIHNADPEDLLKEELPILKGLENHNELNKQILDNLKNASISYKYTRWTIQERFHNEISEKSVSEFNVGMTKMQKIRNQPIDEEVLSATGLLGEEGGGGGFEDSGSSGGSDFDVL